mmetsp:Transcript_5753/g.8343  ORF Transcript_5753/g.8343 Transcript_5753/m.8343 type:complete len:84 (+) Transcript_5753:2376-2627(+)
MNIFLSLDQARFLIILEMKNLGGVNSRKSLSLDLSRVSQTTTQFILRIVLKIITEGHNTHKQRNIVNNVQHSSYLKISNEFLL